jgi:D-3-phosphoglycerate dehydrogenase
MYTIRTYNAISDKGLGRFNPDTYRVGPDLADPDAFILRSQKLHGEPIPESLVAVARAGAGYNNIPVDELTRHGVVVFNTPGGNANAVKELVAAALFLGSREIFGGISYVESLTEMQDPAELSKQLEREKKRFAGTEVAGKTLGVVGLGAIGALVANMALELGMRVIGYDPAISVEAAWKLSSRVEKVESLQSLLGEVDYLSLHVPANEHTIGLIGPMALARMKPSSRLLNFAREQVVDTAAVIAALDSGHLARYITDFPVPELFGRHDTLLLPHIGASTHEAEENCAVMAADQLMDFLVNGNIVNSVNFPRTHMSRNGGYRLTFCNENIPKVLGQVLTVLSDRNINIIDMVNKSRGDFAYNIIDLESEPGPNAIEEILATEGVVRLRRV